MLSPFYVIVLLFLVLKAIRLTFIIVTDLAHSPGHTDFQGTLPLQAVQQEDHLVLSRSKIVGDSCVRIAMLYSLEKRIGYSSIRAARPVISRDFLLPPHDTVNQH